MHRLQGQQLVVVHVHPEREKEARVSPVDELVRPELSGVLGGGKRLGGGGWAGVGRGVEWVVGGVGEGRCVTEGERDREGAFEQMVPMPFRGRVSPHTAPDGTTAAAGVLMLLRLAEAEENTPSYSAATYSLHALLSLSALCLCVCLLRSLRPSYLPSPAPPLSRPAPHGVPISS